MLFSDKSKEYIMAKKIIAVGIILIGSALLGTGYVLTFNAFLDDVLE